MSMSHTEEEPATLALKRHFANRVANQMRTVISLWRSVHGHNLSDIELNQLIKEVSKLDTLAARYEMPDIAQEAIAIVTAIHALKPKQNNLIQQESIHQAIYGLGQSTLRHDDDQDVDGHIPNVQPVILALNHDMSTKLNEQLNHFGIKSQAALNGAEFLEINQLYQASVIIMDVDFDGEHQGIPLVQTLRDTVSQMPPVIFTSQQDNALIAQRLAACRAGGRRFLLKPNTATLISSIEKFSQHHKEEPYRVLIVDDSRSQVLFTEKALSSAGMITRAITDPLQVLTEIEQFHPEIIVMDMYMPNCTGTELAAVIRQQDEYLRLPILFLSGEEDKDIQLNAMSQGGDDFLTKPVDPSHLSITVQNRGHRARVLNNLIVRDSLTGLFNHTHILDRLYQACRFAKEHQQPLCFAMVDIDFFKKINDNYGHPVGDKVISALSLFLKQRLRSSDSIGRYGGEEFAVILPNTQPENALHVMNNIRQVFSQLEHSSNTEDFKVSFSCGICSFNGDNTDHIIEYADEALYAAKKLGRNNVQLYVEDDGE